jgi:hypothetical protein
VATIAARSACSSAHAAVPILGPLGARAGERRLDRRGPLPGQRLVDQHARGIHVAALGGGGAGVHLGRGVLRAPLPGLLGLVDQPLHARDAEVGDLHVPHVGDDHVLRPQVAVHDPAAMRVVERLEDLHEHQRQVDGAGTDLRAETFGEVRAQRLAGDELHRDPRVVGVLAVAVHRDDVGMLQASGDARLDTQPLEDALRLGGGEARLGDRLEGDRAADDRVERAVHHGRAAAAEFARHDVVADARHYAPTRRIIVKQLPLPGVELTSSLPPWLCTIL